jgi:hypothetical protein
MRPVEGSNQSKRRKTMAAKKSTKRLKKAMPLKHTKPLAAYYKPHG